MRYLFFLLILVFFTSCANKEFIKKANYKFEERDTFLIVNPVNDPINLIDIFSHELEKKGFKYILAHPKIKMKGHKAIKSSQGSGFFINENGLIATNQHVVDGFTFLNVKTNSNKNFMVKVLYEDKKNDIAILSPINKYKTSFWFNLNPKEPKIAEEVVVVGYPLSQVLGTDIRITKGIVSSKNGIKGDTKQFQISAAIQPGNSGGPILNSKLNVLGIATSRLSDKYLFEHLDIIPQNVNFGVKSTEILNFLDDKKLGFNENISIKTLDDALEATVLINTTPSSQIVKNMSAKKIASYKINYEYKYYWEFDSISYLSIKVFDNKGKELAQVIYSGDSISSPANIARESFSLIFNSL